MERKAAGNPERTSGHLGSMDVRSHKKKFFLNLSNVFLSALGYNVTKIRETLGFAVCDASEGIFVRVVMSPCSLFALMVGVHSLIIATGKPLGCPDDTVSSKCNISSDGTPVGVDFNGQKTC